MPICIECSYPVSQLYTSYSKADDRALGKGVRLTQCPRCKRFADKYVEHDNVVLFIDLVLIKPQVYRHLLFNRLGRDDEKFDRSIIRLGILLLLFDVYLTWAHIEKSSTLASTPLSKAPIIVQYIFFLTLSGFATLANHLVVRLGASLITKHSQKHPFPFENGTTEMLTASTSHSNSNSVSISTGIKRSSSTQDMLQAPHNLVHGGSSSSSTSYPPSLWPPDTSPPLSGGQAQLRRVSTSPAQLPPIPPPSPPSANAVSTALFVSSSPKLFPILLVIWGSKEVTVPEGGSSAADSPAVTMLHKTFATATSALLSGSLPTAPAVDLLSSHNNEAEAAVITAATHGSSSGGGGGPLTSLFTSLTTLFSFSTSSSYNFENSLLYFLSLDTAFLYLVLLNNIEALYILLDCGYLCAVALAVSGQLARWLVERLILGLFDIY